MNTLPYLSGMFLNLIGFFIGSNYLVLILSRVFVPANEHQTYLLWCFSGLMVAWVGNNIGILIIARKNLLRTFGYSTIGLLIGFLLSAIPLLYVAGIITIFIGCLFGHYPAESKSEKQKRRNERNGPALE